MNSKNQTPQNEVKPSPTPWKAGQFTDGETWEIVDADKDPVCGCFKIGKRNHEANTRFIVRAVNSHDELVALLKEAVDNWTCQVQCDSMQEGDELTAFEERALAAINRAKGKSE